MEKYYTQYLDNSNYPDAAVAMEKFGINSFEDYKIYNSLVVLDHEANILSKYNKNKLVLFGEFLPYENFLKKLGFKKITQGYHSFSPSPERDIINIHI